MCFLTSYLIKSDGGKGPKMSGNLVKIKVPIPSVISNNDSLKDKFA